MSKTRVLVTGAKGFIGTHLCDALSSLPYVYLEKVDLPTNICHGASCHNYVTTFKPNVIYHLAASTKVNYNPKTALDDSINNMIGTQKLLEYAGQLDKPCTFVFTSTVHIYGDRRYSQEVAREDKLIGQPVSLYAATKLAGEQLIQAYTNMGMVNGVILRLTSCVGKNMTHGVVADMIKKFTSNIPVVDILGEFPGTTRPFLHVSDAISAMILFGLDRSNPNIYNITCDNSINIDKVVQLVAKHSYKLKMPHWLGKGFSGLGDVSEIYIDNSKAKNAGWQPKYKTSEEAIEQAIKDNIICV